MNEFTRVTIVASTHDQPNCRHSQFCTKSIRGNTDKTYLVKMTKNSFQYSLNDEGIGLFFYPTSFQVVVTQVWRGFQRGPLHGLRTDRFLPNFNPHQTRVTTTRHGVEYIVHNSSNSSSLSEYRKFVFLSFSLGILVFQEASSTEF